MPSAVIDRGSVRAWKDAGGPVTVARAAERVADLVVMWRPPEIGADAEHGIRTLVENAARRARLGSLPAAA